MKQAVLIVGLLVLSIGCGGGEDTIAAKDTQTLEPDTQMADVAAELNLVDQTAGPDVTPDFGQSEAGAPDSSPECAPGEGCFLDKCQENGDCLSGWCVEHMGVGVCSTACQEDCPPGWGCKPVGSGGPDIVYICVSDYANLCKPCVLSSDCKNVGGADDVCVDYGAEGNFCGGICDDDQECPWGFTCKEAMTIDGVGLTQCVADAGVCPCTDKSVELGLWTQCGLENEFGACQGMRICTEQGLSICDAAKPAEEQCNGQDDDCDGETDEPVLYEGKYLELCDDDNPCTEDACIGEEGCQHTSLTEGECVDGDACTIGDHCQEGQCVGLPIACDDSNVCTDDVCDGLGGCTIEFNQASCDDGDPCTVADQCSQGECDGYQVDCECLEDEDCGALEDGDLCNGTLFCDTQKIPYQCAVAPETMVECATEDSSGSLCLATVCVAETGECATAPAFEGYACNDGDLCTIGDACQVGDCVSGVDIACADNNLCTDDTCDPESGCLFTNNTSVCNDANPCTILDACDEGECVGSMPLNCDDGNPCTDDSCSPDVGCMHMANQAACDDGDDCTSEDQCVNTLCLSGDAVDCNDDNPCTEDLCLPVGGCLSTMIMADCTDGNPCTVNDQCINGLCVGGMPVNCDDDNPCTDDSCNDDGICIHDANEAQCTDGNQCTTDDHCLGGACVGQTPLPCDDENLCTSDSCDPAVGCVFVVNDVPCDDGDFCTIGDVCNLGDCMPQAQLTCDDGNLCTDDSCDPKDGCHFVANVATCNDGNLCTQGDQCAGGWCGAGQWLDCKDDDPCTDDQCDPGAGCVYSHNQAPCNDGDQCTIFDQCLDGSCSASVLLQCDDGNACTDDSCDSPDGCSYEFNSLECDDNVGCTVDDQCSNGSCQGVPCESVNQLCWQGECVDSYCGDGACDDDENTGNCAADCTPDLWFESSEVEWFPIKYPHPNYAQSLAVATCKNAGLRLWRDEVGPLDHADWVYDIYGTHNLGGHDIGYKVQHACANQQEGHDGTWVLFDKAWSDSIKGVSGASDGQQVTILNKQAHADDFETTASYTVVTPQSNSVVYVSGEYSGAVTGLTYGIVLCAKRK